jgi:hypothetical protein
LIARAVDQSRQDRSDDRGAAPGRKRFFDPDQEFGLLKLKVS